MSVFEARKAIRPLFDDSSPADAPNAYYALFHPVERSALFPYVDEQRRPVGFVGRFQTGADLFRPLVTLKCPNPEIATLLLEQALIVGRPYILFAGLSQLSKVGGSMHIENQRIMQTYTIDPSHFEPQVNVMVEYQTAHDGTPRYCVQINGEIMAAAGLNWQSPAFAEIYVHTQPEARQKGWGRSVAASLSYHLLKKGLRAIYLVDTNNEASLHLVQSLGFVDTGSRQVYAEALYMGNPMASNPKRLTLLPHKTK